MLRSLQLGPTDRRRHAERLPGSRHARTAELDPSAPTGATTMARIALLALVAVASTAAATPPQYSDGRPAATMRMDTKDHGIVLRYGDGPDECDILGARDVWVFEADAPTICTMMRRAR